MKKKTILKVVSLLFELNNNRYLLHIMSGYQCDKAVTKHDTRQVI